MPVPVPGYILLHIDEVDHDAASLTKDPLAEVLTLQGAPVRQREETCWLASFWQVWVGTGVRSLHFSVRDENLEPADLESKTCRVHISSQAEYFGEHQHDGCADSVEDDVSNALHRRCHGWPLTCQLEPEQAVQEALGHEGPPRTQEPLEEAVRWAMEWRRFERFKEIVCSKCARRRVACGCKLADNGRDERSREHRNARDTIKQQYHHPAFDMLATMVRRTLLARVRAEGGRAGADAGESEDDSESGAWGVRRVVVNLYSQGVGNQLLSMVNGMLLALVTNRLLAVHVHTTQVYDLVL